MPRWSYSSHSILSCQARYQSGTRKLGMCFHADHANQQTYLLFCGLQITSSSSSIFFLTVEMHSALSEAQSLQMWFTVSGWFLALPTPREAVNPMIWTGIQIIYWFIICYLNKLIDCMRTLDPHTKFSTCGTKGQGGQKGRSLPFIKQAAPYDFLLSTLFYN